MVIRRIDGASPVTGPGGIDGPKGVGSGFGDLAATGTSAERARPAGEVLVERAVADVVAGIRAGSYPEPAARVDAVIARVVELRLGDGARPAVVKAGVEEAQTALGGHPAFAAHVQALIERALASAD